LTNSTGVLVDVRTRITFVMWPGRWRSIEPTGATTVTATPGNWGNLAWRARRGEDRGEEWIHTRAEGKLDATVRGPGRGHRTTTFDVGLLEKMLDQKICAGWRPASPFGYDNRVGDS